MSTTFPAELACPHCPPGPAGEPATFPVELYTNLHVSRSPERRAQILAGQFSVFACPACGGRIRVEPTMLYTDFETWKWYAVFARSAIRHRSALVALVDAGFHHNLEVAAPPMVREWGPQFTRRVVFGLASLRDKLLCDDHGLDDRALEALKWLVLRESAPSAIQPATDAWLDHVEDDRLVLGVEPPAGSDGTVVTRWIGVARERLAEAAGYVATLGLDGEVVDWRAGLWPDDPLASADGHPRVHTPWMSP